MSSSKAPPDDHLDLLLQRFQALTKTPKDNIGLAESEAHVQDEQDEAEAKRVLEQLRQRKGEQDPEYQIEDADIDEYLAKESKDLEQDPRAALANVSDQEAEKVVARIQNDPTIPSDEENQGNTIMANSTPLKPTGRLQDQPPSTPEQPSTPALISRLSSLSTPVTIPQNTSHVSNQESGEDGAEKIDPAYAKLLGLSPGKADPDIPIAFKLPRSHPSTTTTSTTTSTSTSTSRLPNPPKPFDVPGYRSKLDNDPDQWCVICNKDADVACKSCCDGDYYCTECFDKGHLGQEGVRVERISRPS